jgi:hypothetical protein
LLNTILGSFSSGVAASTNSYESIATVTVGSGGSASISFTSIPSTYSHLQIRGIARTARSAQVGDPLLFTFNSDSASNYNYHYLQGDGSGVSVGASTSQNNFWMYRASGAGATASVFGAIVVDILDYKDTNKFKTVRGLGGVDNNGGGDISLSSAAWRSTSAITSITIVNFSATNFQQYSTFALYGIKGAL